MIPLCVARTVGAAAVVTSCVAACQPFVQGCAVDANSAAENSGITVDIDEPYRCVYTVKQPGGQMTLLAVFEAPSDWWAGELSVHNMHALTASGFQFVGGLTLGWVTGPTCDGAPSCLPVSAWWPAATGLSQNGLYTDRYIAETPTPLGNGSLQVDFTGIVGGFSVIAGPTGVTGGSLSKWQATVVGDTLSYQYQWLVNGVARPGEHARSFHSDLSWLESGSHTLTGIAQLMDQTTDTVTRNVTLSMGAGWTGPTVLAPYETGTWNGFAYSGRDPISCQWWVDGAAEPGSSCSLSRSFEPNTTHNLALYVTDARSITAYGGDWPVVVTTGGGGECCDQLRVPSEAQPLTRRDVKNGRP